MSENNQTLIKEHKGSFYVFSNVNAESWDAVNELLLKDNEGQYDNRDEAYEKALEIDEQFGSEYGVQFNRLCKDGAVVLLK